MSITLRAPLRTEHLLPLRAGDQVLIDGVVYVARDAAHRRMVAALAAGEALPFDPQGQIIYYMGPTPPKPGQVIGSAGPTTAYRMDAYTPAILAAGARAFIGKGQRSQHVRAEMLKHEAVYLAAIGGTGALLARHITAQTIIAYPDLGPEAVRRLEVHDFPAIVVNDLHGVDLFEIGPRSYRQLPHDLSITHISKGQDMVYTSRPKARQGGT